jgi:GT2 family glycosyltransferase
MTPDIVGVVAIGRNEGERLIRCLESLRSVTGNIVYVDSGSTDGSVPAAKKLGATITTLDKDRSFTAARARNEGFAALQALCPRIRFVQFVDGDCSLAQDWLKKAVLFLEKRHDVAIVCGRRRERRPEASVYNALCDIEWNTPIGEAAACGGDALVRVAAFEAVGGFRAQLIAGEEPELCLRLRESGWKIWRIDAEMTQHDAAMSRFGQWWLRTVRSGYGMAEVSRLHRDSRWPLWRRETVSALLWGLGLPTAVIASGLVRPLLLCSALIYPLQMCRIAIRRGGKHFDSWIYATFAMLAKFAQIQGISKFYWRLWRGQAGQLIEYKR